MISKILTVVVILSLLPACANWRGSASETAKVPEMIRITEKPIAPSVPVGPREVEDMDNPLLDDSLIVPLIPDEKLKLIHGSTPEPPASLDRELRARVKLLILEDGTVGEATVQEITDLDYIDYAEEVARDLVYSAPTFKGHPIRARIIQEIRIRPR